MQIPVAEGRRETGGISEPVDAPDCISDAQRQLAELENIYRTVPVGLLFLDTDLRYVHINERLAAINGVPAAAHIGRTIWEVLPEIAPVVAPDYLQVIASGEPIIDKEVRGYTKAHPDVEHDYLVSYYPVKDNGRVAGVTAVVQDITAQKEIEEALRQSERRFALFMQNLPGAAWMKDWRAGTSMPIRRPNVSFKFGWTTYEEKPTSRPLRRTSPLSSGPTTAPRSPAATGFKQ